MIRIVLLAAAAACLASASGPIDLFGGFQDGWRTPWMERAMAKKPNALRIEERDGNRFLHVRSMSSASALWREVELDRADVATLSWRWHVEMSLDHLNNERRRREDDYAARVAIMFDGEPFDRKTPTLMYVWSGSEPIGSVYPSPYTNNVATFVLRSGDVGDGEWLMERRDVRADFVSYFDRAPERITAVALMVDTDNTKSETTAWFDDLVLSAGASPGDANGSDR